MSLILPAEGGCQCGAYATVLRGEPVWLAICHCSECKRQSGAAFGMSLRVHEANVQLTSGAPKRWTGTADSGRLVVCHFCGNCGIRVWHEPVGSGFVHVKPGTLDDPSQLVPRYEGWTRRKVPWLKIDGLEGSFDAQGPSRRPDQRTKLRVRVGRFRRTPGRPQSAHLRRCRTCQRRLADTRTASARHWTERPSLHCRLWTFMAGDLPHRVEGGRSQPF
jgi:hypothetical protein